MADDRRRILHALRGRTRTTHDPLGGMAENLGEALLPEIDLETASRRLLGAVGTGKGGAERLKRVLRDVAETLDLSVVRWDPADGRGTEQVDEVLRGAERTAERLREWAERMERQSAAVVIRSSDPGVWSEESQCGGCGLPNLLAAAVDAAETKEDGWCVVVLADDAKGKT